ncbi:hypothetical protein [uncultured Maribacter sp.]|uniref:hypothetical protein n=1 Tax=uncultured Maribacter sp. TaxID=431308 RepID=UPI00261B016D|nr:hypothetical protein [uncultured Maribacter sp.]
MASQQEIRGVYESCIGVPDLISAISFWNQFGYRIVDHGELSMESAKKLYNVNSKVKSVQLQHLDSDHSFIRLMQWDKPINKGIGYTANLRHNGGRWCVLLTKSVLNILNHVEDAITKGDLWSFIMPHWLQVYQMEKGKPFFDRPLGVREGIALHPYCRLAIFERYNYEKPTYGKIDENSFLKSSQFTHHGILLRMDDIGSLKFYDECLGLLRQKEQNLGGKPTCSSGNQQTFGLSSSEVYSIHDFDDPRSSLDVKGHLSGRLKIVRMFTSSEMKDVHDLSRPGSLGMSLLTYQVRDIEAYRKKVINGGATEVTEIYENEFKEPSISFKSPDGLSWNLVGNLK